MLYSRKILTVFNCTNNYKQKTYRQCEWITQGPESPDQENKSWLSFKEVLIYSTTAYPIPCPPTPNDTCPENILYMGKCIFELQSPYIALDHAETVLFLNLNRILFIIFLFLSFFLWTEPIEPKDIKDLVLRLDKCQDYARNVLKHRNTSTFF